MLGLLSVPITLNDCRTCLQLCSEDDFNSVKFIQYTALQHFHGTKIRYTEYGIKKTNETRGKAYSCQVFLVND